MAGSDTANSFLLEEALEEAFAEVDTEGNGEISFGQFKQLIHNLLA
jgi:hypothetical protein